jgi:signal transduction histidine kinase
MPHGDKKTPATRAETDSSLRAERTETDKELARRRLGIEEDADAVVRTARDRADATLDSARHREDQKTGGEVSAEVSAERSREDAALARQRVDADATLAAERVRRQMALAGLLVAEREATDLRLLIERARTDEILSNRDDFLAIVSHDMRSFLGNIALSAEMLERQGPEDPARFARYTASIQRATAQMARLVADLLDVASLDAGKFVLVRGPHDAGRIVREAAEAFEPTTSEKGIALSVDVSDEDLIAELDPDRIAQVLANLLGNAAKFTRPGGKITLGAAPRGGEVCVSVSDTGEGIPPERLDAIFERYSQIERTDRGGLGLGLYTSQRIVEEHGGRLWAESIVGEGSTFFLTIPAPATRSSG